MKKQLFLSSALALVTLASCGGNKSGAGLKVGLICIEDVSSTYDKNFIDAFTKVCENAKKNGFVSEYRCITNIGENQACADAAEELVNDGYNVIFSDSFGHDQYMHQVAEKHPNVFFSSATGVEAKDSGLKNFHNAFASIYEGRYLAGVAGGQYLIQTKKVKKGDSFTIGYVGAKPYAEVISGFTAWYLGVKSVCGDNVTMKVRYTNDWYNESKEKLAAETLINEDGCILISQHADSMGAPTACRQLKIPNVSYNMSTVDMDPQCASTYVAHSRINWEPYYNRVLQLAHGSGIEGEKDQNWTGDLDTNSVQYGINKKLLSDESQKVVANAENAIKTKSIDVFDTTTFTVNNAFEALGEDTSVIQKDANGFLTYLKADLIPDEHYERDTNIVDDVNKVVMESVLRSAPGFDIIIDGIEIVQI